jgi:hypothetical protein
MDSFFASCFTFSPEGALALREFLDAAWSFCVLFATGGNDAALVPDSLD